MRWHLVAVSLLPLRTAARAQVVVETLLESQSSDFSVSTRSDDDRSWLRCIFVGRVGHGFDARAARTGRQLVLFLRFHFVVVLVGHQRAKSLSVRVRRECVRVMAVREVSGAHHDVHHFRLTSDVNETGNGCDVRNR